MAAQGYLEAVKEAKNRGLALLAESDGWKVSSSSNDIWKIESKPSDKLNCSIYRVVQRVKAPLDFVVDTINVLPGSRRQEWDTDIKELLETEKLEENKIVYVMRTNPVAKGVISPREFVNAGTLEKTENGAMVVACSVDHPASQVDKNHVRAVAGCIMFKIEKDQSDPDYLHVSSLSEIDLKGRLPRYLLDTTVPMVLTSSYTAFRKFLEKEGYSQA